MISELGMSDDVAMHCLGDDGTTGSGNVPNVDLRSDGRQDQLTVLQTPVGRGKWTQSAVEAQNCL